MPEIQSDEKLYIIYGHKPSVRNCGFKVKVNIKDKSASTLAPQTPKPTTEEQTTMGDDVTSSDSNYLMTDTTIGYLYMCLIYINILLQI